MIDIENDKRLALLWESEISTGSMSVNDIAYLAKTGIEYCDGYCPSRDITGADRCRCIRERFPSPEHYKLYQEARNRFEDLLKLAVVGKAASLEAIEELDND